MDLKLSYTYRFGPFCVPGLKSWFWKCHCVQNHQVTHQVTHENCWQMFDLTKTFVWKKFWKNLLLKIGQSQPKRNGKILELFLNFFFQTMICSQNVLQTQGFQTLTSDFQYRAYSWRFFNFWKFYLFFIILNLKCVEYSIVCRDVWKIFWKKFTSENRPKSAKKEGKNFWTFFSKQWYVLRMFSRPRAFKS